MRILSHPVFRRRWFRCVLVLTLVWAGLWAWETADRLRTEHALRREIDAFRAELRKQGFKTEWSEMAMSLTAEDMARLAIATNLNDKLHTDSLRVGDWMQRVETNDTYMPGIAICAWQEPDDWSEAEARLREVTPEMDAMQATLLDGKPLRYSWFDEDAGLHPDAIDDIMNAFTLRMALAIRGGRREAAWTNLLALTGLATRYQTERMVSNSGSFASPYDVDLVRMAFAATWEATQTNFWTDAQLEGLERVWREADFFREWDDSALWDFHWHGLMNRGTPEIQHTIPVIMSAAEYCLLRGGSVEEWTESFGMFCTFLGFLDRVPYSSVERLRGELAILHRATNVTAALHETRRAGTWKAVAENPAFDGFLHPQATNSRSALRRVLTFNSQVKILLPMPAPVMEQNDNLPLARYAEMETYRRVSLAALAVERAKRRLGRTPATLADAGFLENDFMTGDPLIYSPGSDGSYAIRSPGLDLIDQGGLWSAPFGNSIDADIVWPRRVSENAAAESNSP